MTKPARPGTPVGDFRRPRRAPLDVDAASSQHASSLFPCEKTTHHPRHPADPVSVAFCTKRLCAAVFVALALAPLLGIALLDPALGIPCP
jgi:hypothetical protein